MTMTPKKLQKAITFNTKEIAEDDLIPEHIVKMTEYWQEGHGLVKDGWCGGKSQTSLDEHIAVDWLRVITPVEVTLNNESQFVDGLWLPWDGPQVQQPINYSQARGFFGDPETSPGSDVMSKAWYKANMMSCHEKLGNRLPGIPTKWWIQIHKKVEPYLREALRRAQLTSEYAIDRMGSYNFRHIRNNPNNRLSMHAMGAAIDIDYPRNGAVQFRRGADVPEAWSPEWNKRWPHSVDRVFVQAMSSCGFTWGSDWDEDGLTADHRWQDPMHFEWLGRDGNSYGV